MAVNSRRRAAACSKVKVVHVLSDEEKEGFEHGFITADLIKKYAAEDSSIFICGPEAMYRFVGREVEKLRLPRRLVRNEMLSGEVYIPAENEFRRHEDKEFGYIHPCCTFVLTDAEIEVPGEYY